MLPVAVGYAQKAIRSGVRLGRSVVRAPLEKEARRLKNEAVRRGNLQDRFILMVSFARVNSANPSPGCRVLDPVRDRLAAEHYKGDPVRAFVLTSPR